MVDWTLGRTPERIVTGRLATTLLTFSQGPLDAHRCRPVSFSFQTARSWDVHLSWWSGYSHMGPGCSWLPTFLLAKPSRASTDKEFSQPGGVL